MTIRLREKIEDLIEESNQVSEEESVLLKNIFHLRDFRAHDIMIPRAEIKALEENSTLREIVDFMSETRHSKIPIYHETLDNIIGILNVKDIITVLIDNNKNSEKFVIKDIVRQDAFDYVSPAMKSLDLLSEMQKKHLDMVFVVDEYGGVDGLITIEDLVDQVIGDLDDDDDLEHDYQVIKHPNGVLEVNAKIPLEDMEEIIGCSLTKDKDISPDIDSLGGFVADLAGRIPGRGEIIKADSGIHFQILESDSRRIKKLKLYNIPNFEKQFSGLPSNTEEPKADSRNAHN